MKHNIIYFISIIVLSANVYAKKGHHGNAWHHKDGQEKLEWFVKHLELSKDQKDQFNPIHKDVNNKAEALHEESRMLKDELRQIIDVNPNHDEVKRIHNQLHQIRLNRMNLKYDFLNDVSDILTAKQMGELILIDSYKNGKKHKKGKKHHLRKF